MAVTVLSSLPTTAQGTGSVPTPYTALTLTAGAGSDRLMLLFVGFGSGTLADRHSSGTPTYGGQSMTQIGTGADDGNFCGVEAWYLKETNVAAASNTTFSIPNLIGMQLAAGAVLLAGVDQTTPIDTGSVQTYGASGTSATVTVSSATGHLAVATLMTDDETINTSTAHNQTSIEYSPVVDSDTRQAAQYASGAASVTLTWTQAAQGAAVLGFEVNAAAGGGGGGLSVFLEEPIIGGSYF